MKSIAAVLLGGLIAAVTYWVGAIITFLSMHGIPLGSAGGPATRADVAANLAVAIVASIAAGAVVSRLAPMRPLAHVVALALGLAVLVLWSFTKPTSQWPSWYPAILVLVGAVGTIAGGLLRNERKPKPEAKSN